jgi:hypothetical protein
MDMMTIVKKLSLIERESSGRNPHPVYWYYLDGQRRLKVTMPNQHGGARSLTPGFLNAIKRSLHLTTEQFIDLAKCPLSADEYEEIVRNLNL